MLIVEIGEKYSKKTNTKLFQEIVNNFDEKNLYTDLKLKSIIFINTIIYFCNPKEISQILNELINAGILELLLKMKKQEKNKFNNYNYNQIEIDFQQQIDYFLTKANEVL